ncbi:MAG: 5-formyltetrahydrofolate cyclo-ligase [Frankiaceae bacterium]|nr:5-formyltetrahydrofolate cyclo-ligase [Frankiaceae bacterium]
MDRAADGARLADYADELITLATRSSRNPTIAAYAGVEEEPPTRALLDALVRRNARLLLPVLTGDADALDWAPYEGWDALSTARWGLLEPTSERLGSGAIGTADLVVVPALAVDRAGHRLGRGRGFYDRALANVDRDRTVAVVYASELLDHVPSEPHDRQVGWALTPNGLTPLGA